MSVGMQFILQIELGNDAMRTREDVARALTEVSYNLRQGKGEAKVFDENGNKVGEWSYENDDEERDDEEDDDLPDGPL